MKKISIVYWSNGGNVEVLANAITDVLEENGAEVKISQVADANIEDVMSADAVAFGSPSMDNNRIEQHEMEPFIKEFKLTPNNNKPCLLFGSYGWDDGKFMVDWVERMKDYGFDIVGDLAVKESPTDEELKLVKELAMKLI